MNFDKAYFESASGRLDQLPESTVPEIVFSGRSNVGKSSLINKVLNRKALARVSAKPGKTGTINFYNIQNCRLVDLPGYGYAKVSRSEKLRWAELVEGYLQAPRNVKLLFQIIDIRHEPTADDLSMIHFLLETRCNFVLVATKSDKLSNAQRDARLKELQRFFEDVKGLKIITFSAVTAEGAEEIRSMIDGVCGGNAD